MGTLAIPARQLFAQEARQPERDLDLARAALLVAKEQYPGLAVGQYLARLDQLAEEVKDRLADETAPLVVLRSSPKPLRAPGLPRQQGKPLRPQELLPK